ncbi:hypothetical protein ABFS83_12G061000 [Erythranthe nasuta]
MAWNKSTDMSSSKLIFLKGSEYEECGLETLLYSNAHVLGRGTFGTTFKAQLPGKAFVAVKRLKGVCLPEIDFAAKVKELAKMAAGHENLLPLKAYCCHMNERLLLHDYRHHSSLASALHGSAIKIPLSWEERSSIAYGIARGISYLHSQPSNICHGNIRSSNIFISHYNDRHSVQISEYCMAQLATLDSKTTIAQGYRAPEVTNLNTLSQKSDIYAFGVVLLELLTGKAPLVNDKGTDLPKWVRSIFHEKPIIEVFDSALHEYKERWVGEQMVRLLQIAVCCTFEYHYNRPSMAAVTNRIRETCNFKP